MKGWKKIVQASGNQKRADIAIVISNKIDFNSKAIRRDKENHYIMIKQSIHQKDIIIINIYAPNIRTPKYTKQILTDPKGEKINNNAIIIGEFNNYIDYPDRK